MKIKSLETIKSKFLKYAKKKNVLSIINRLLECDEGTYLGRKIPFIMSKTSHYEKTVLYDNKSVIFSS